MSDENTPFQDNFPTVVHKFVITNKPIKAEQDILFECAANVSFDAARKHIKLNISDSQSQPQTNSQIPNKNKNKTFSTSWFGRSQQQRRAKTRHCSYIQVEHFPKVDRNYKQALQCR